MAVYFIETYILSVVGYLFYRLIVCRFAAPIERKYALVGIVVMSLLLPLLVDHWEGRQGEDTVCLHSHVLTEIVCVDYCPSEEDLPVCYDVAAKQEHFCRCSRVTPENILVFKPNKLYDSYLLIQPLTNKIITPIFMLLGFVFLLKIAYLVYLITPSRRQKMVLQGYSFTALYPKYPLAVGSFKLWGNYVIWQHELSALPLKEQEAVLWHEIAHLQHKDTWLKIILDLLQFIWLLNPVFYAVYAEINKLNEYIADHFAIGKVQNIPLYVNTLLKMKQAKTITVFQTFKPSGFKERITWLVNERKQHAYPSLFAVMGPGMVILLLLWTTTLYTMPQISKEMDKVRVYQKLAKDNENSGRSLFCKHCLLQQLNTPTPVSANTAQLMSNYIIFD